MPSFYPEKIARTFSLLPVLRCLAAREEGVSHDLTRLPPCHVSSPPEVRPVLAVTWLVRDGPARIARHHSPPRQAHDLGVEGVVFCYVRVELAGDRVVVPRSVGDDLANLPPGGVLVGSEVRAIVGRVARLCIPKPTRIATHVSSAVQPLYELIERRTYGHILEALPGNGFNEASGVRDHLGYLPSRHVVARAECPIGIARDDTPAGEAADVGVKGVLLGYVRE